MKTTKKKNCNDKNCRVRIEKYLKLCPKCLRKKLDKADG